MAKKRRRQRGAQWSETTKGPQQPDARDEDALGYVTEFLRTFTDGLQMERISLLTPESARDAQQMLAAKRELLDQRMQLISALKKLF
jgi:hypothetical protein